MLAVQPTVKQEAWRYADPAALATYTSPTAPEMRRVDGAQLVVETLEPGSQALAFDLAPGAHLTHLRLASSDLSGPAFAEVKVNVAEEANYTSVVVNFSSTYVRNEIHVDLNGKGAHTDLLGTYLLRGKGHSDTLSRVHHAVADTTSDEVYKGVLTDQGRSVFQAQIRVAPDAQRIVGNQMHRALMLSDDARVDAKPELEIFADDVQCSHGATVGELDPQHLFYLASRGVPAAEAQALLIQAFLDEVLEHVPEAHRAACDAQVQDFLKAL